VVAEMLAPGSGGLSRLFVLARVQQRSAGGKEEEKSFFDSVVYETQRNSAQVKLARLILAPVTKRLTRYSISAVTVPSALRATWIFLEKKNEEKK
jgi:acid stress-induced BolA-like protein IbaG/YrbA